MTDVSDWWRTSIIDMEPGRIAIRGTAIEDLIGNLSFPQMIWLMVTGQPIEGPRAQLFEAALVAAVDHGPQAPSIAASRMAITCGVGLQSAMATGLNMLGDVHGGAGEQAVSFFQSLDLEDIPAGIDAWRAANGPYLPGFGHRFHTPTDPRAPRLVQLVDNAVGKDGINGAYAARARAVETSLLAEKNRPVPLNIDGATAVIFAELGCPPALARGFFCLSRSVGLLAHSWEQSQQGGRNKGPTPPGYRWTYDGA